MSHLYIFNPDNDVALASGQKRFTPPRQALTLRNAAASLMRWVAPSDALYFDPNLFRTNSHLLSAHNQQNPSGDSLYVSSNPQPEFTSSSAATYLKATEDLFGALAKPLLPSLAPSVTSVTPWGWSAAIKTDLINLGINSDILPPDSKLSRIRQLSHRRTAIEINHRLRILGFDTPLPAIEITDASAIPEAVIVKSPWSSSGRGIIDSTHMRHEDVVRQAVGIIRRQHSVTVEPRLDKIADFAMLFKIDSGIARFKGFSSFFNSPGRAAYTGNVLGSQSHILKSIDGLPAHYPLSQLASALEEILSDIIRTDYTGWCGIDMLTYSDNGTPRVAPCIELNLRMTMGVVALQLSERFLADGSIGTMKIIPKSCRISDKPISVCDGRIHSGEINLVTPNDNFNIVMDVTPFIRP